MTEIEYWAARAFANAMFVHTFGIVGNGSLGRERDVGLGLELALNGRIII